MDIIIIYSSYIYILCETLLVMMDKQAISSLNNEVRADSLQGMFCSKLVVIIHVAKRQVTKLRADTCCHQGFPEMTTNWMQTTKIGLKFGLKDDKIHCYRLIKLH